MQKKNLASDSFIFLFHIFVRLLSRYFKVLIIFTSASLYKAAVNNKDTIKSPNNLMIPYEQTLGDSGEEKFPFRRKSCLAEPDLGIDWRGKRVHKIVTQHSMQSGK